LKEHPEIAIELNKLLRAELLPKSEPIESQEVDEIEPVDEE